jgi:hypothetical protein
MLEGALCLLCGGDAEDVLWPLCGYDGSRWSPRVMPPGKGEAGAPLSA